MSKTAHDHAARIAAAETATAADLAAALDAYRAEGAAAIGGGGPERLTWPATVQHLIDHPPYTSYCADSAATKLRALWADVPIDTPYGVAEVTLFRTEEGNESFDLRIPAGGSFIINGAQYAPGEGVVTHTTIGVEHDTSYDGKRTAWQVRHAPMIGKPLSPAAKDRLREWIEAEGFRLIFTPARIVARNVYDAATNANRLREERDKAHAAAIAADADWNRAAGDAALILNAAVVVAGGAA